MERPNPVDTNISGITNPWSVIRGELATAPTQNWTEYVGALEKAVEMSKRMTKVVSTYLDSSRWPTAVTQSDLFARRYLDATG